MGAATDKYKAAIDCYKAELSNDAENARSYRQIAADFNVNHSALHKRMNGVATDRHTAAAHLQKLGPGEEQALVALIIRSYHSGHPITPKNAKATANTIIAERTIADTNNRHSTTTVGKNWVASFKDRNPSIMTVWTTPLQAVRYEAVTRNQLDPWFSQLGELLARHRYPPQYMFNLDETGYNIGVSQSTRVLSPAEYSRRNKRAKKSIPGRQEWVTTLECVSAAGTYLPPMVIYAGKRAVHAHWKTDDPRAADWAWFTSPSGWTNDYLMRMWLEKVFEPATRPDSPNQRRLLVLDGHGSHMQASVIGYCLSRSIDLMVLPAHTSHVTQPLDVGVFAGLKHYMGEATDRLASLGVHRIQKGEWACELVHARAQAFTRGNIEGAWFQSGIHPFEPSRVLEQLTERTKSPSPPPTPLEPSQRSLTAITHDILEDTANRVPSPIEYHLNQVAVEFERTEAARALAEARVKELEDVIRVRKRKRKGKTVAHLGTHLMDEHALAKVQALEAATAAKKAAKGAKDAQAGPSNPLMDITNLID